MARQKKQVGTQEERLAQFWLKSVGCEAGLYNSSTGVFTADLESQGLYQSNVSIFSNALQSGWTYDELHSWIGLQYRKGERCVLVSDLLPRKEKEHALAETDDLLEENEQYFHDALFDVKAPSFAVAGAMMLPVSRGSVTRKDKFTLRDLMDYYYENVKTGCVSRRREAQTKTMAWLLSQATLDEVLFAIDAASLTDQDVPVVELTNYLDEARREIKYFRARSQ